MITSPMKLSMKVSLFRLSKVFKNLEWKPIIDVWIEKFKVSI